MSEEDLAMEFEKQLVATQLALRKYAIKLSRDPVRADDLVQETMLRAWEHRKQFTIGTSLMAWLTTICRNTYVTQLRKGNREVEDVDGGLAVKLLVDPGIDGSEPDLAGVISSAFDNCEQLLSTLLAVAVGDTYDEVALQFGVPVGTVKSRVHRARAVVRGELSLD